MEMVVIHDDAGGDNGRDDSNCRGAEAVRLAYPSQHDERRRLWYGAAGMFFFLTLIIMIGAVVFARSDGGSASTPDPTSGPPSPPPQVHDQHAATTSGSAITTPRSPACSRLFTTKRGLPLGRPATASGDGISLWWSNDANYQHALPPFDQTNVNNNAHHHVHFPAQTVLTITGTDMVNIVREGTAADGSPGTFSVDLQWYGPLYNWGSTVDLENDADDSNESHGSHGSHESHSALELSAETVAAVSPYFRITHDPMRKTYAAAFANEAVEENGGTACLTERGKINECVERCLPNVWCGNSCTEVVVNTEYTSRSECDRRYNPGGMQLQRQWRREVCNKFPYDAPFCRTNFTSCVEPVLRDVTVTLPQNVCFDITNPTDNGNGIDVLYTTIITYCAEQSESNPSDSSTNAGGGGGGGLTPIPPTHVPTASPSTRPTGAPTHLPSSSPTAAPITIAPSCTDTTRNGHETDVDCGGNECPPCGTGDVCTVHMDCMSGRCGSTNPKRCMSPTASPTSAPTLVPTNTPTTRSPTMVPTDHPITIAPSYAPTFAPTPEGGGGRWGCVHC